MDDERKRQLKQAYGEREPAMGVLEMRCLATGERFLIASRDPRATENGLVARFDGGNHPNKRLQALWSEYDDAREDHAEELQALLELCLEEHPEAKRVWR